MKIEKYITIEQKVEIEIDSEDIQIIFSESDSLRSILSGLNTISTFMQGIHKSKIDEMTDGQRAVVAEFLSKESERYNQSLQPTTKSSGDTKVM